MSERNDLLEFDSGPRVVVPPDAIEPLQLDLVDRDTACFDCGGVEPLDSYGRCEECAIDAAAERELGGQENYPSNAAPLADIAAESAANASAKRDNAWVAPTTRGSGETAEDSHASDAGIAMLRAGREARAASAAVVRQREVESAIAARADAEHERLESVTDARQVLKGADLIAGAAAEGHGVLVGWRGKGDMTRAAIAAVLASANLPASWIPEAVSAEAQAARAVATLKADGYSVQAEKKGKTQVVELVDHDARWMVNATNFGGKVGDKSGDIILVATLVGDRLSLDGDDELAARVRDEYEQRIADELCKSSDITGWLQDTLVDEMDAVRYGVGWYVPRRHAATANTLCQAFEAAGWGAEDSFISPALPIATGEQLRTGLLRGLSAEVRDVMHDLTRERETAKTKEARDDIGNKRAATFLGKLKAVGRRVVAYGALIGADRVETMKTTISDAMKALESSLSEEDAAIVARFQNIWEEIEMDRQRNGGTL